MMTALFSQAPSGPALPPPEVRESESMLFSSPTSECECRAGVSPSPRPPHASLVCLQELLKTYLSFPTFPQQSPICSQRSGISTVAHSFL